MCSLKKANLGTQQWKNAHESLLNLEKSNVASVDSIVRYVQPPSLSDFCTILSRIAHFSFSFKSGEEWKPIKTYVRNFLLPCQLP
jgi:hypothetical protein